MPVACWSNMLLLHIMFVCVPPGLAIRGLRIAWSEATTTHNSNVLFAYYRSNRSSLCFSTVVVVKLCSSNTVCSAAHGSRLGGQLPPLPPPPWLCHWPLTGGLDAIPFILCCASIFKFGSRYVQCVTLHLSKYDTFSLHFSKPNNQLHN